MLQNTAMFIITGPLLPQLSLSPKGKRKKEKGKRKKEKGDGISLSIISSRFSIFRIKPNNSNSFISP
jgi:hypothetical protein